MVTYVDGVVQNEADIRAGWRDMLTASRAEQAAAEEAQRAKARAANAEQLRRDLRAVYASLDVLGGGVLLRPCRGP